MAAAGAVLLVGGEFSTLYEVRVLTTVPDGGRQAAGPHHGYAMIPVAAAIVIMAFGAARGGSRPSAIAVMALAVVALAVVALVIALAIDRPATDDTGLIGETYDLARSEPGPALWLELAGGGLALTAGVGLLLTSRAGRRAYQR